MRFDYQMYLRSDLYSPLALLVVFIAFTVVSVVAFVENVKIGNYEHIAPICMGIIFIVTFSTQVIRGLPLLKDRDLNTIQVKGKIERIERLSFGTRHTIDGDVLLPVYITVDGNRYYSVSMPWLAEGDQVELAVLPNSKYVMECIKE